MKIKKGDKVKVISGKDKGKVGTVDDVNNRLNKVTVSGVGLYKKHVKPSEKSKEGGIVEITKPIMVSKVMLTCPKCSQTTRVGFRTKQGKKLRFCRRCSTEFV